MSLSPGKIAAVGGITAAGALALWALFSRNDDDGLYDQLAQERDDQERQREEVHAALSALKLFTGELDTRVRSIDSEQRLRDAEFRRQMEELKAARERSALEAQEKGRQIEERLNRELRDIREERFRSGQEVREDLRFRETQITEQLRDVRNEQFRTESSLREGIRDHLTLAEREAARLRSDVHEFKGDVRSQLTASEQRLLDAQRATETRVRADVRDVRGDLQFERGLTEQRFAEQRGMVNTELRDVRARIYDQGLHLGSQIQASESRVRNEIDIRGQQYERALETERAIRINADEAMRRGLTDESRYWQQELAKQQLDTRERFGQITDTFDNRFRTLDTSVQNARVDARLVALDVQRAQVTDASDAKLTSLRAELAAAREEAMKYQREGRITEAQRAAFEADLQRLANAEVVRIEAARKTTLDQIAEAAKNTRGSTGVIDPVIAPPDRAPNTSPGVKQPTGPPGPFDHINQGASRGTGDVTLTTTQADGTRTTLSVEERAKAFEAASKTGHSTLGQTAGNAYGKAAVGAIGLAGAVEIAHWRDAGLAVADAERIYGRDSHQATAARQKQATIADTMSDLAWLGLVKTQSEVGADGRTRVTGFGAGAVTGGVGELFRGGSDVFTHVSATVRGDQAAAERARADSLVKFGNVGSLAAMIASLGFVDTKSEGPAVGWDSGVLSGGLLRDAHAAYFAPKPHAAPPAAPTLRRTGDIYIGVDALRRIAISQGINPDGVSIADYNHFIKLRDSGTAMAAPTIAAATYAQHQTAVQAGPPAPLPPSPGYLPSPVQVAQNTSLASRLPPSAQPVAQQALNVATSFQNLTGIRLVPAVMPPPPAPPLPQLPAPAPVVTRPTYSIPQPRADGRYYGV